MTMFMTEPRPRINLSEEEVHEICKPLRQKAALCRYLARLLNTSIENIHRRPDGFPLVSRAAVEAAMGNRPQDAKQTGGVIRWSKNK